MEVQVRIETEISPNFPRITGCELTSSLQVTTLFHLLLETFFCVFLLLVQ